MAVVKMQSTQNCMLERQINDKIEKLGRVREAADSILQRHKQDGMFNFDSEEQRNKVKAEVQGLVNVNKKVNEDLTTIKESQDMKVSDADDESHERCDAAMMETQQILQMLMEEFHVLFQVAISEFCNTIEEFRPAPTLAMEHGLDGLAGAGEGLQETICPQQVQEKMNTFSRMKDSVTDFFKKHKTDEKFVFKSQADKQGAWNQLQNLVNENQQFTKELNTFHALKENHMEIEVWRVNLGLLTDVQQQMQLLWDAMHELLQVSISGVSSRLDDIRPAPSNTDLENRQAQQLGAQEVQSSALKQQVKEKSSTLEKINDTLSGIFNSHRKSGRLTFHSQEARDRVKNQLNELIAQNHQVTEELNTIGFLRESHREIEVWQLNWGALTSAHEQMQMLWQALHETLQVSISAVCHSLDNIRPPAATSDQGLPLAQHVVVESDQQGAVQQKQAPKRQRSEYGYLQKHRPDNSSDTEITPRKVRPSKESDSQLGSHPQKNRDEAGKEPMIHQVQIHQTQESFDNEMQRRLRLLNDFDMTASGNDVNTRTSEEDLVVEQVQEGLSREVQSVHVEDGGTHERNQMATVNDIHVEEEGVVQSEEELERLVDQMIMQQHKYARPQDYQSTELAKRTCAHCAKVFSAQSNRITHEKKGNCLKVKKSEETIKAEREAERTCQKCGKIFLHKHSRVFHETVRCKYDTGGCSQQHRHESLQMKFPNMDAAVQWVEANYYDQELKRRKNAKDVGKEKTTYIKYQCRRDGKYTSKAKGIRYKVSHMRTVKNKKCNAHIKIQGNAEGDVTLFGCVTHDGHVPGKLFNTLLS